MIARQRPDDAVGPGCAGAVKTCSIACNGWAVGG